MKLVSNYYCPSLLIDYIKFIEEKYPVDKWLIGDIYFWPIIRRCLPLLYIDKINKPTNFSSLDQSLKKNKIHNSILRFNKLILTLCNSFKVIVILSLKTEKKHSLFISNGISKININNKIVDRFIYPYIKELGERNCLLFESNLNINNEKNKYIQLSNIVNIAYYIARLIILLPVKIKLNMDGYDLFIKELSKDLNPKFLHTKDLKIKFIQIRLISYFFQWLISKYKITSTYIVAYYSEIGYGLCHASKKTGVTCTDIQHGTFFNHVAYIKWSKVPVGNYNILPNTYSIWHEILKKYLNDNNCIEFNQTSKINVDGLKIVKYIDENSSQFSKKIQLIKNKFKTIILVTLQPQFDGLNDWDKLAKVIKLQSEEIFWIIRKHPVNKNFTGMDNILNLHGQNNILYDEAQLNLFELLKHVNCHITTNSSTVLEAFIFNVKTIFISIVSKDSYPILFENGYAFYAQNESEIMKLINEIRPEGI